MRDWTIALSLPHGLTPGGMTTWAIRTARALAEQSARVIIVAHKPADEASRYRADALSLPPGVSIEEAPHPGAADFLEATVNICLRHAPVVYFPSTHETSFSVAVAPGRSRIIGWNHSNHAYDHACLRHVARCCTRVVVNTRACEERVRPFAAAHGVPVVRLPHVLGLRGDARPHRADGEPLRVAYAGRLEQTSKRVADLLTIARRLRARNIAFHITIAGDGPERATVERSIAALHGRDGGDEAANCRIALAPPYPPDRAGPFWASTDCLLLPSAYEGLSYQLIEAMAMGAVPVVSRIPGGLPDVIEDGVTGLTFAIGDCDSAAEALERLARDRVRLRQMSRAAQCKVADAFDDAHTARALMEIIHDAIAGPPRPWPAHESIAMRPAEHGDPGGASDAELRIVAALERAAAQGHRRLAIYGAGRHTQDAHRAFARAMPRITVFIDDDARRVGQSLWGRPIVRPCEALAQQVDAVIISSQMNEREMLSRCGEFAAAGIPMIPLYGATRAEAAETTLADAAPHLANIHTQTRGAIFQ